MAKNINFQIKKTFVGGRKFTNDWLMILFLNFFLMFFNNGFWFYSMMGGWSTWQWVVFNTSQFFWSFDTPETPGSASVVFADNQSETKIWNRMKQFLPVFGFGPMYYSGHLLATIHTRTKKWAWASPATSLWIRNEKSRYDHQIYNEHVLHLKTEIQDW